MDHKKSDISGFHELDTRHRLERVREIAGLTEEEAKLVEKTGALDLGTANIMIENVIGTFELPLGIATNFRVNGRDYLIPMVLEEPSVVAAASNAAKLARVHGGFKTSSDEPVMIGQIQVVGVKDIEGSKEKILHSKKRIIEIANSKDPGLVSHGGGAREIEIRTLETERGRMLIVHLLVDVRDAMGANAVNTMAEAVSPLIEELTEGSVRLKIISNLAVHRTARAEAVWDKEALKESVKGLGLEADEVVDAILDAYAFAANDQFRCTTHNKGIMNGIDAVSIATGNDFRALEAGAHSYASYKNTYMPLTSYSRDKDGNLAGRVELPLAVGTIGGSMRTNPMAKIGLKILGVKNSREFAEVLAAVGLAQNFAAMRALATEGIQKGHMRLHAKNIAITAGATGEDIERVARKVIKDKQITVDYAKKVLQELK